MKCKTVICSSVGMKRKINQDNFYVNGFLNKKRKNRVMKSFFASKKEQILCICDGMGGEKFGEEASLIAVEKLFSYQRKYSNLISRFEDHINAYVQSANNAICAFIQKNNGERSGSTMALLCISPKQKEAVASNIGDSKVFLLRNNELRKISMDHNQAQSLVNVGLITEDEARTHKDKSKLTQHLGIFPDEMILEPHISDNVILKKNDIFLICSDGLTDMLSDPDIINILKRNAPLKKKCKKLVETANRNGGVDNTTVILAEIV